MFLLLATIFFSVGFLMIQALKIHFKRFYLQFKCILWAATILLTLPLTFRSIFDFTRLSDKVQKSEQGWNDFNVALYNLFVFLLTTYLPILF